LDPLHRRPACDTDAYRHDNRRYWLLSLTDSTGQVIARTETRTPTPDVTIDGHGTVWATNIIAVHSPTGALPPPIPLAELLTHHQADPPRPQ